MEQLRGLLNTFLLKINYTQQVDNCFVTYAIYRGVKCLDAGAGYLKNLPLPRLGPGLRHVQRGSAVPLFNKNPRETVRKGSRAASGASIFAPQSSEIELLHPLSWTFEALVNAVF